MAMSLMSSLVVALTVTSPVVAVSVSYAPVVASVRPSTTRIVAETPTPALDPTLIWPAMSQYLFGALAMTDSDPPALTVVGLDTPPPM